MATHKSAEKRDRQNIKANERNSAARSQVKTAIKNVRDAVAAGSTKEELTKKFRAAQKVIASSSRKGVLSPKTGSRYTSRLASLVSKSANK